MSKTPISILQEIVVQRKEKLPDYHIENCDMECAPFKCTVSVGSIRAVGYATTKKDAKQSSAKRALEILGYYNSNTSQQVVIPIPNNPNPSKSSPFINFVGKLNELASTHHTSYPVYDEGSMFMSGQFLTECSFLGFVVKGYGLNKKSAKQDAAQKMLQQLKEQDLKKITVQIENMHLETAKSSPLIQEIKNIYDKLQVSENNSNAASITISPVPTLFKSKICTMADLKKELSSQGYQYEIKTFQNNPFIMMMKICDSNVTIMGKGETKEHAVNDLFENIVYMLNHGFAFNNL